MKKILTIAGSDCSGGAGIQADIKTIAAQGMYAMSVITSLTAQNTTGVYDVLDVPAEFVARQIDCIFTDIRPDAVKIGMVSNPEIIATIVQKLKQYEAENIVVDPVMVSTSGSNLLKKEAMEALCQKLLPLARVITPNLPEAEALSGQSVHDRASCVEAAEKISQLLPGAVLIKGGHLINTADDFLYDQGRQVWFAGEKIDNSNTHGTGCTLSSAIACGLAAGLDLSAAIEQAKEYISGALRAQLNLGAGSGPLDHMYQWGHIKKSDL